MIATMRKWRCPHCMSTEPRSHCTVCNRTMCESCISHHGDVGPVCGLCYDRIAAEQNYERYLADMKKHHVPPLSFDEWYDINA